MLTVKLNCEEPILLINTAQSDEASDGGFPIDTVPEPTFVTFPSWRLPPVLGLYHFTVYLPGGSVIFEEPPVFRYNTYTVLSLPRPHPEETLFKGLTSSKGR